MFANGMKVAGAAAAIAATFGVSATMTQAQQADIVIDGSSTVFPISEAMAELFNEETGITTVVGVSGTGGGFSKFCAGETDISDASRPIKPSEEEACAANGIEYTRFRVGTDAITVAVSEDSNLPSEISMDELAEIWGSSAEGNNTWNGQRISLYGPGTDSGTFDFFVEEVLGDDGESRADYTASEDDNILVTGVSRDTNALGYFGLSYYLNNLNIIDAVEVDGEPPVLNLVDEDNDGVADSFSPNDNYPLSRPLFIYVNNEALEREEVSSFVEFYLETAMADDGAIITEIGYVPASQEEYEAALEKLTQF